MIAEVSAASVIGLEVVPVRVEVDLSNGLPGLTVVGLPDKSVDESRERVRSAVRASGGVLPPQRITVNLSPADLKKEGPAFDLAIAVGILAAAEQVPAIGPERLFIGELSLGGELRPVRGVLPMVDAARQHGITEVILPKANAAEAALVDGGPMLLPADTLTAVIDHLRDERRLAPHSGRQRQTHNPNPEVDLTDIRGQARAKRALEVAAAGGHNLLFTGPPGTGKTLLAKAMPGIMPPLTYEETIEVTRVYSVAGLLATSGSIITDRPFRSPHHSISLAGLIGGGSWPRPGELSLAHRGVLFLDELPQFPGHLLEALRGPLEDRRVRISRARHTLEFPSDCLLVGSLNPCPCGFADDPLAACTCAPVAIQRYRERLSGPIRDRMDLTVEVPRVSYETIRGREAEPSDAVRERVVAARERQYARFGAVRTNSAIRVSEIGECCNPSAEGGGLLAEAVDRWRLSVRGYHRVLKVARTIADLAEETEIGETAVAEALQYREVAGVAA